MITINVGCALPDGVAELDPQDVALAIVGSFPGASWALVEAEAVAYLNERTVVAQFDIEPGADNFYAFIGKVYRLAVILDQDCIAVSGHDTTVGELIGPNAKAWGDFNTEFFITFKEATS